MRIIKNRTGNVLPRPLRILSILRGQWDGQRAPALQALADIGHEVVYVDELLELDGYRKLVQRIRAGGRVSEPGVRGADYGVVRATLRVAGTDAGAHGRPARGD